MVLINLLLSHLLTVQQQPPLDCYVVGAVDVQLRNRHCRRLLLIRLRSDPSVPVEKSDPHHVVDGRNEARAV